MRSLRVDMQTLMPLREVTCCLMHILRQQIQYFVFQVLTYHVSGVVQAAQAEFHLWHTSVHGVECHPQTGSLHQH